MREMTKLALLAVPLAVLVCVSWLFVLPYYSLVHPFENADIEIILGTLWAVGITLASAYVLVRQYLAVRVGLRLTDERSRVIALRAGYYSFWLSVGWWFLLSFIIITDTNAFGLFSVYQAPEALVGGLMAMPVIYCLVWSYMTHVSRPGLG